MLISVAMCTYNGEAHLREQLESIAAQSLLPDEVVICDDRSTDATPEIVKAFAAGATFSVRFVQNDRNLGFIKNFEKAIGLCRADLIALSDQDDIWHPEKLAHLSALLIADPALGGVFSNAVLVDDESRQTGLRLWDKVHFSPRRSNMIDTLLRHDVITGATLMFRADLRDRLLPVESPWIHDAWFAWMIALYAQLSFVDEPLIQYRIHASQQVGVGPPSRMARLARAKKAGLEQYLVMARQFEVLRNRWLDHPGENHPNILADLDGKIRHSYLRASLPGNRILRAHRIARTFRGYQKYSRGFVSMLRDVSL
jgi:glycosyltransferase involved in cell wall biosynthesis